MSESTFLSPADASRPLFIGVDVGGTNVKIGVVDDDGRPLGKSSIVTEAEKPAADAVERIRKGCFALLEETGVAIDNVAAVGLGCPGTMDIPSGRVLAPVNLPGWRDFPIRDELSKAMGKPVGFANDANAAAFGEYWVGSGREYHSMIMLTLGTGVGGGIIIGDESIDGEHSHGSECGHIIIDYTDDARSCSWGGQGHLEAYASATAVAARTREALEAGRASSMKARAEAGEEVTSLMVYEEAEKGDKLAEEIVLETAMYVGVGATCLMHVIDPAAVILGGAMDFGGHQSQTGRRFLERVRQEVKKRAFPMCADNTEIDFATLGGDAGYIGAAGVARTAFHRQG